MVKAKRHQLTWGPIGLVVGMAIVSCVIGCGEGKPTTRPVTGKITFKGTGKPLDRGTIMLMSVENPDILASGDIQPDGTFELFCTLDESGTVEGDHRVMIQEPILERGEKPLVAKKYKNFDTSQLTAKVGRGNNDLNIELDPLR
jgi:hypothetical protein